LFFSEVFSFFGFWSTACSFSVDFFLDWSHLFFCLGQLTLSLEKNQELLPNQASVVIRSFKVGISRCHSLEVYNIATLVCASDALDLNTTCQLYFFAAAIDQLINLNVQLRTYLFHHIVEFLIALNGLLLVDSTIFSQTAELGVIQDSWDDGLSYDSVPTVVDDCGGQEVQFVDLKELKRA
jgi:hypothetical protein